MKILLIIDIQKKYQNNFNKQYLNKVQKFIEKTKDEFDEIVYMVDFTDKNFLHDYVPAFILENTDCMLQKSYTKEYEFFYIVANTEAISGTSTSQSIIKVPDGAIICQKNSCIYFIDKTFLSFIERWKKENAEIYLIGGGLHHCVKKTKKILKEFKIKTHVMEEYCYIISPLAKKKTIRNVDWRLVVNKNEQILKCFQNSKQRKSS